MPANRSRTTEWRRCLKQIRDRNGAIEIAVSRHYGKNDGRDLIWRVRVLDLSENEIIVEQPSTLGHTINLKQGVELLAIIAIGQNRWMFQTTNLGMKNFALNARRNVLALRLLMPATVERCQRRNYYRVDTTALNLPQVEIWPLLDPKSVVLAERANEVEIDRDNSSANGLGEDRSTVVPNSVLDFDPEDVMPDVGPRFSARLLNIGGGGVGLLVEPNEAQALSRHKIFWLRLALPPRLTTPICASGKLVHTHVESTHQVYAGLAFDFSFNPGHQKFVVDQICRYIAEQQREQLQRQRDEAASSPSRRRSA